MPPTYSVPDQHPESLARKKPKVPLYAKILVALEIPTFDVEDVPSVSAPGLASTVMADLFVELFDQ